MKNIFKGRSRQVRIIHAALLSAFFAAGLLFTVAGQWYTVAVLALVFVLWLIGLHVIDASR